LLDILLSVRLTTKERYLNSIKLAKLADSTSDPSIESSFKTFLTKMNLKQFEQEANNAAADIEETKLFLEKNIGKFQDWIGEFLVPLNKKVKWLNTD